MVSRVLLVLLVVAGVGCSSPDAALVKAPKPGLVGKPRYDTMHNSSNEYVSFASNAPEGEVRKAFEEYCRRRGLVKSGRSASSIVWYESKEAALGILISGDRVTYFSAAGGRR